MPVTTASFYGLLIFLLFIVLSVFKKHILLIPWIIYFGFFACFLLYHFYSPVRINLFSFENFVESNYIEYILEYSALAFLSFTCGVILIDLILSPLHKKKALKKQKTKQANNKHSEKLVIITFFLSVISVISLFYLYKTELIFRHSYALNFSGIEKTIYTLLFLMNTFLFLLLGRLYNIKKVLSVFILVTLSILNLATGSRRVLIYLIAFWFNIKKSSIVVNIGFFLFFSYLSVRLLELRRLENHGLVPYILHILSLDINWEFVYFLLYYIVIFGHYVSIISLQEANLNFYDIVALINPLPGVLAGVYTHEMTSKITIEGTPAPMNLYGMIFSEGYLFTVIFFFIIGVYLNIIQNIVNTFFPKNSILQNIIIVLIFLYGIFSLQYNLRAPLRFLYYISFLIFAYILLKSFFKTFKYEKRQ